MAYVNLREYIEVLEAGKRPKGGAVNEGVPSLGGEHITNTGKFNLSNDKLKYVPREYYDELKKGKIKINDVLVVKDGATTGKTAIVEDDFLLKEACINEHVFLLRTKDSLNPKYLFYYFLSEQGQQEILKDFRGATVGGISKDFIDMDIYISDLDTQKKIVEVLDKAQELIDKRKEQIEALDELVKSRFIEMFGNPFIDEKNFGMRKLGEVTIVNPKKAEVKELDDKLNVSFVPMEKVGEKGEFNSEISKTIKELYSGFTYFRENDVLFAKITPCMENGKGAVATNLINGIGFGSTEFHVIRPIIEKSNPYWIYHLSTLIEFRRLAERKMTGSAGQKRVPTDFINNLKVVLPPIELQNQFADFVNQVDKLKSKMETSLKELEDNFNSLMQKAFKGELF